LKRGLAKTLDAEFVVGVSFERATSSILAGGISVMPTTIISMVRRVDGSSPSEGSAKNLHTALFRKARKGMISRGVCTRSLAT